MNFQFPRPIINFNFLLINFLLQFNQSIYLKTRFFFKNLKSTKNKFILLIFKSNFKFKVHHYNFLNLNFIEKYFKLN